MILLLALGIGLLAPSLALAWGPLTHLQLAQDLMAQSAALLPPAIFAILKAYPKDFLYGNVIADVVVGKKFQEPEGESHSWHFVQDLLHLARTPAHRAFIYGYQAHLAADTVAHNEYIPRFIVLPNLTHTLLEMKADSLVDPKVWKRPEKRVQMRNDILLMKALEKTRLKFSTNKMLFQGILELTAFHRNMPVSRFIGRRLPYQVPEEDIRFYVEKSLKRMLEVLVEGEQARVRTADPLGRKRHRVAAFAGR